MSRWASTPRLRITRVYYVALTVATAVAGGPRPSGQLTAQALDVGAIALVSLACLGRIWCSAFIAGRKDEQLVTNGPYSTCRHPLYAFSFLGGQGLGLATHSLTLTVTTGVVLATLFAWTARAEEQKLALLHPCRFAEYARVTPRWWPRWNASQNAQRMDLAPRIFRKSFLDAGAFILLYLLIDTVRALREAGVLPTLLSLP